MARAFITGITGQDGSYLADLLLERGYEVHGLVRRASESHLQRIAAVRDRVVLHEGDLLDQGSLIRSIDAARPDEVYNLAAQSFVGRSWQEPVHTAEITGLGALRVLEAVRIVAPKARVYQASTSEMFGNVPSDVIGPTGPFHPRSPYGTAKLFAHASAVNFRESFGLHVSCGILFNHESPRRGEEFVTRKVCIAAARIAAGLQRSLALGDLTARRDWGWAPDFVRAMADMLALDEPVDLVVATGTSHSVEDLCRVAFAAVGLDWRHHVVSDPAFCRPAEVHALVGDPSEAAARIGWKPEVGFREMIERMVAIEVERLG